MAAGEKLMRSREVFLGVKWMKFSLNVSWLSLAVSVLLAGQASADIYHYNNVIVGNRAMGMGGAFCAVADDASAVVYNPAGLAFALSNDISGSANAFYKRAINYKKTIGDQSFTEHSRGQLAPFFGGLQKLDHLSKGLVGAFGLYLSDSDLKDQNDIIETPTIERFHRTVNLRAATGNIALAVAKRLNSRMSVGFALNYLSVDELVQEFQGVRVLATSDGIRQNLQQNIRQRLLISGLEPTLGVQVALTNRFTFGLQMKKAMILSQEFENSIERYITFTDGSDNVITSVQDPDGTYGGGVFSRAAVDETMDNPMGNWPAEIRTGFAWFANTRFLWTLDVIHRTATNGDYDLHDRGAVTNYATGLEYYATPSIPIRFGLFTNNDTRPEVEEGLANQQDHVDWTGMSLFVGWATSNSQLGFGYIGQLAEGKAQKIGGTTAIQEVEGHSSTLAVTVTTSL